MVTRIHDFDALRSFLATDEPFKNLQLEISSTAWPASSVVEWLQQEIDASEPTGKYRRRCTKCLSVVVRKYQVFPLSFFCNDIQREGNHPLAGGGFADVYKGSVRGQQVCLKVLRVHTQSDEEKRKKMIENFCQEALIWTQLDHPNVLKLLGVNTDLFGADFCLVSPWMVHGDVIKFLKQNPNHDKLRSIREIAAGLEYLHSRSPVIVHGDIRGANILVDENLSCRLADFGLSREAAESTMMPTSTGAAQGCLRWMAPEIFAATISSDPKEDRSPRDIYAFACTVLEIITGKPPFADLVDGAVIAQVLVHRTRPQRPNGMWCPDTVWTLVEQCWDQDKLNRPTASYIHGFLTTSRRSDEPLWNSVFDSVVLEKLYEDPQQIAFPEEHAIEWPTLGPRLPRMRLYVRNQEFFDEPVYRFSPFPPQLPPLNLSSEKELEAPTEFDRCTDCGRRDSPVQVIGRTGSRRLCNACGQAYMHRRQRQIERTRMHGFEPKAIHSSQANHGDTCRCLTCLLDKAQGVPINQEMDDESDSTTPTQQWSSDPHFSAVSTPIASRQNRNTSGDGNTPSPGSAEFPDLRMGLSHDAILFGSGLDGMDDSPDI